MASKLSVSALSSLRICCSAISVANRRMSHGTLACRARFMSSRQNSFCRPRTAAGAARLFLTAFTLAAIFALAVVLALTAVFTLTAVFALVLLAFVFLPFVLLVLFLLLLRSRQSSERDHERRIERFSTVALENDGYCVGP